MRILVSNDDGIEAPGLQPLVDALSSLGEVQVIAPRTEQSASSHALTMHKPLRAREHKPGWTSVTGTPADCIYMAVHHLLPQRPDLVVSGINRGSNLGTDVLYSGTVAAAMEACMMGLPALAVSLSFRGRHHQHHWETAAGLALLVASDIAARGLPRETVLNLNVPDLPRDQIRGIRACRLGRRHYHPLVDVRKDPRGRPYYWIGGEHHRFADLPGSDGPLIEEGWATLSPLQPDLTADAVLPEISRWPSIADPGTPGEGG